MQAKFWLCSNSVFQAGLLVSSLGILSFTNIEGEPGVALQTHFVPLLLNTEPRQKARLFSSPFVAVYSSILPQLSTGLGDFFVTYMLQGPAVLSAAIID